jgi:hypothetical protein
MVSKLSHIRNTLINMVMYSNQEENNECVNVISEFIYQFKTSL